MLGPFSKEIIIFYLEGQTVCLRGCRNVFGWCEEAKEGSKFFSGGQRGARISGTQRGAVMAGNNAILCASKVVSERSVGSQNFLNRVGYKVFDTFDRRG